MINKFIVFEGLDGSGSSTQASLLHDAFAARAQAAVLTNEPSDGVIGHLIREFFKGKVNFGGPLKEFDRMLSFLFAADRIDHLYNNIDGIEQVLNDKNVISTRYFYSSLAYHATSTEEMKYIYALNCKFRKPDFIFYLQITPEISMQRIAVRHTKDCYENYEKMKMVAANYEYILSTYMKNAIIIDGSLAKMEIHSIICNILFNDNQK